MTRPKALGKQKNYTLIVFAAGLLVAAASYVPYIIYHKGLFLYYGDFNVQQIPFYQLVHEAIRSGDIWWSWKTDLGANFIGSYSFYNLFSPFFWLTIPFPTAWLPYLMAPLLILKHACAGVTAFWYLRRFVRDTPCAAFCSLLYAFSGYTVYNIFFNHFHEVIVFFPLLLIGLEKAMMDNKRGWFALSIALNAVVNYWFFIGEVVFVVVYFFVRLTSPQWHLTLRKFLSLAAEVLLGMGLAMFAFLPAVLAIMGNPRTTADTLLSGTNLWYYSNPQRYLGILHSLFFAPDPPALNNLFPDHGATWASLSAYLPVVGAVGAMAYWFTAKKDWLKKILGVSAILALVPLGNHLFVLLNYSYYARWYYMPTLMLVLATAKVLESPQDYNLRAGLRATGGVLLAILVISGLTPHRSQEGEWVFGIYNDLGRFLATTALTVGGFLATAVLLGRRWKDGKKFRHALYSTLMVGCFLFTFCFMLIGKATYSNNDWITDAGLPGRDRMLVSDEVFARSDIYKGSDNLGMYWNIPNIQAFHSIVPVSLMEFYPEVGVKRDVSSKPETQYSYLRPLLSVRWLYISGLEADQEPMPGYTLVDSRLGYNIYENEYFIPMGFSYDFVIRPEQWDSLPQDWKSRALLFGMYLSDEAADRNRDLLDEVEEDWDHAIAMDEYEAFVVQRRSMTCDTFEIDNRGFTATSAFDRDRLVFFSVPYDKGWHATVNGQEALVEKANIGFMAVRVPAGESVIRFEYTTPGLWLGLLSTGVSAVLLALFVFLTRKWTPDPYDVQWEQTVLADIPAQAVGDASSPVGQNPGDSPAPGEPPHPPEAGAPPQDSKGDTPGGD